MEGFSEAFRKVTRNTAFLISPPMTFVTFVTFVTFLLETISSRNQVPSKPWSVDLLDQRPGKFNPVPHKPPMTFVTFVTF